MTQQDERNARVLPASNGPEFAEIAHQAGPTPGTEIAVAFSRPRSRAVAAVVVGVHHVPGVGQGFGQSPVPTGMFAHPVRDLHDRLRGLVTGPAVDRDVRAVGRRE